ncbi:MAG: response regulator [Rhodocyclaceae bacterium]|nr:response regulator [Rhodocyclaceae bacterium]
MSTLETSAATILVASDNVPDAGLVKKHLEEEFAKVATSTNADAAAKDFERHRPDVLVLAFDNLEKAERYYLGLYRLCPLVQQHVHRTVILCNKDEVKRVYELCKKNYFDDYVLFWPMTYDMSRLAMAVHHALRELSVLKDGGPSVAEFAAQARRLAELEGLLEQRLAEGSQHLAVADQAMAQAEQGIGAALDGFSRRLIDGAMPEAITVNNADALRGEIGRLKREEVGNLFRTAAASAAPAKAWADGLDQAYAPHRESTRALGALADRVRPTVLVADDDEFQRKIVARILEAENYHVLFAGSGLETLSLLRKTRPDLILMDVMMPDLDGVETTRRIKAVPQFVRIPVIMVTGNSEKAVVAECLKAGASGFLVKPFERDTLITKVAQALRDQK